MPQPIYPFDSTGTLPSNKITNELTIVTMANGINAYLIRPDATPFYGSTMVIVNSNGVALEEGIDYYLTHHWAKGTEVTGLDVYGTITLLNHYPIGNYRLNYQTIGGEYVTAVNASIQDSLTATAVDYVNVDWSDAPTSFPAIPHTEELSSIHGMTQVYQALHKIADAVRSPTQGVHYDDLIGADIANVMSTVEPYTNLIETIALLHNDQAKLILDMKSELNEILQRDDIPRNLRHYTIPLAGMFKLKIGEISFEYGSEPTFITFIKPAFSTQCLFAFANVTRCIGGLVIQEDKAFVGKATRAGVKVKIVNDPAATTGTRLLSYIAIGI